MRSSLVLFAVGIAAVTFGLYLAAVAVSLYFAYSRELAACEACVAFPCCDVPPSASWLVVALIALPVVLLGAVPLVWSLVRLRRERRQRSDASSA